jgi:hypothetical protein
MDGSTKGSQMNERKHQLQTRFAPETRFDVPALPFREVQTSELEQFKTRLLRQLLTNVTDTGQNVLLRRAANVAAALVWLTPCPLLLFPVLLEEKARAALAQYSRQKGVRRRSANLLLKAA